MVHRVGHTAWVWPACRFPVAHCIAKDWGKIGGKIFFQLLEFGYEKFPHNTTDEGTIRLRVERVTDVPSSTSDRELPEVEEENRAKGKMKESALADIIQQRTTWRSTEDRN